MAELTAEQKNAISHRGRAARQLSHALGVAS
jgi:inosine/xanthosine triphosphate pyrophosphatase family protein